MDNIILPVAKQTVLVKQASFFFFHFFECCIAGVTDNLIQNAMVFCFAIFRV